MELKLSDLRLSHEYGRGFNVCAHIEDADAQAIETFIKEHRNGFIRAKLTKWSDRRSLNANAYAWVLIDKIATRVHSTPKDVYRNAIRDVGGNSTIVCVQNDAVDSLRKHWESNGIGWLTDVLDSKIAGCTNVVLFTGSSEYDKTQMNRLIENLIQDAKAIGGIETLTPNDLDRMMQEWS